MNLDPTASDAVVRAVTVTVATEVPEGAVVGVGVTSDGDVPTEIGLSRDELTRWGFRGKPGQTLPLPGSGAVAVGLGAAADVTVATVRDAAAVHARAVAQDASVVVRVPGSVDPVAAAGAAVEGVILGRYRFDESRSESTTVAVREVVVVLTEAGPDAEAAAREALVLARATCLARDLANTPPSQLDAPTFAEVAERIAGTTGLEIVVHDKAALVEMGCGGLLGVNRGSDVEPRMVRLTYRPDGESRGHLGLVGKGITYDSGGISLKPSDPMHASMKMDMAGAGAVLAAMSVLRELEVPVTVSAYLALTDNMPDARATKLGDVLTSRAGRTIEVVNTDAEGRLVMVDAIALAKEDGVDAIVDIATLTGAVLAALGTRTAGLVSNDDRLAGLVAAAGDATDEGLWRLPLDRRMRPEFDSEVADLKNLAGKWAGTVTAAVFLAEWVGDTPWVHVDMAGTMRSDADEAWRVKGATGYGARLLARVARDWTPA